LSLLDFGVKAQATSGISGGTLRKHGTEGPSVCQRKFLNEHRRSTHRTDYAAQRADARRNYEKVLAAARDAFAASGEATSLEEIARRAGVGIGTLYRHFPNRRRLITEGDRSAVARHAISAYGRNQRFGAG
jgi:hypothetical protein